MRVIASWAATKGFVAEMLVERRAVVVHERQCQTEAEPLRPRVGEREVVEERVVLNLGVVDLAMDLLDAAREMAVRQEMAEREAHLPVAGFEETAAVEDRCVATAACDHAALCSGGVRHEQWTENKRGDAGSRGESVSGHVVEAFAWGLARRVKGA
jgi:hypothetical protein